MQTFPRVLAAGAAIAVLSVVCGTPLNAQHRIAGPDSLHPRVRYADSLDSANDRCIVSGSKLNPAMHPVYVNEQPVGFC